VPWILPPSPPPPPLSGVVRLVAGVGAVANTRIKTGSLVLYSRQDPSGTLGELYLGRSAGVGFSIHSASATETSHVLYQVVSY
jgi:hypothetical protein